MSKTFIHRVENQSSVYVHLILFGVDQKPSIPPTGPIAPMPPIQTHDLVLGPKQSVSYNEIPGNSSLAIPTVESKDVFEDNHILLRVGSAVYALYEAYGKVQISKDALYHKDAPLIQGFDGPGSMNLHINEDGTIVASGGLFTGSELAAVSWATSNFAVYGTNLDNNNLIERHYKGDEISTSFYEGPHAGLAGPVAAVSWILGRFTVFALARNGLVYEKRWPDLWNEWREHLNPQGVSSMTRLAAVCWVTSRYGIYAVGDNRKLYQMWWEGGGEIKHTWEDLGGQFLGPVTAVSYSAGRYAVYGIGMDGRLWEKWWPDGWAEWKPVNVAGIPKLKTLTSTSWHDRCYAIAGVDEEGNLWRLVYIREWGQWQNVGHPTNVKLAGPVAAVCWIADFYAVYAVGKDGLTHRFYDNKWQ